MNGAGSTAGRLGFPRWLALLGSAFVLGLIGLLFFFGDLAGDGTMWARLLGAALFFFVVGALLTWVARRRWFISILACWATALYGLLGLLQKIVADSNYPLWSFLFIILLAPPAFSLLGGYCSARALSRRSSETSEPTD